MNEEKYRIIVENSIEAILVVRDEKLVYHNAVLAGIFGYSPDEMARISLSELVHPDDRDIVYRRHLERLKGKPVPQRYEARVIKRNGDTRWVEFNAIAVTWEEKPAVLCFTTDITERKAAEDLIRVRERDFSSLVENAGDMIVRFDTAFRHVYCNKAVECQLGKPARAFIGKTPLEADGPREQAEFIELSLRKALATGKEVEVEQSYPTPLGKKYFHTRIVPERDENHNIVSLLAITRDITERKKTEEALRESEEHNKLISEMTSDYAFIVDVDAKGAVKLRWVSDSFPHATGRALSDIMTPDMWRKIIAPEDQERFFHFMNQIIREKKPGELECRSLRGDHEITWLHINVSPRIMDDGRLSIIGAVKDITSRKMAEEALRKSEERFETVFRSSPIGITLSRLDNGQFALVNDAFVKLSGFTREEMIESDALSLRLWGNPADRTKLIEILETEGRITGFESVFRAKTGEDINGMVAAELIEMGGVRYILASILDITERKKAEEALRDDVIRLRSLFETTLDVIFILDRDTGCILDVNPAACRLYGYTYEEFLRLKHTDISAEPDKTVAAIHEGITHVPLRYHRRKDGTVFPVEITSGYCMLGNRSVQTAFIRDITERLGIENEKRRMEEHIHNAQKLEALGVLAGGIAHDFNNLLGGIFGFLDMAFEASKDEKVSGFLSRALNTIDRARALTQQLLTFAKGGVPVRKPCELFPFVEETARFALSGSNVSCRFDAPRDLWPVNIDKNQIAQVIDNLIINAEQAMPMGGVILISARNLVLKEKKIANLPAGDYVKLSLQDSGTGIPPEIMPRIFDPFFTTKQKGSGLGLATCYSIVIRHDGFIEVESEPSRGSTFHVYLPAVHPRQRMTAGSVSAGYHGSGTILIADDEEAMRDSMKAMLEALGYCVEAVDDGRKAVDFFSAETKAKRPLAAIIIDLTIPGGMGGRETVAEIRKMNTQIPIFVSSGYGEDPVIAHPNDYGFNASISKPFVKSDLAAMLALHLKGDVET
jgi:PAS domain S-box-containing protein